MTTLSDFLPAESTGPSFTSLYSGAGGLDLGFFRAGFRPVWANDVDPDATATYNSLFGRLSPGHRAVTGDIRKQDVPGLGEAEVVIGGPPCQGFSVAGRMDPNDPRSRHVWDFMSVIDRIRPRAFVMENVLALAVSRRWHALRQDLFQKAVGMGYQTTLLKVVASDFGVPQNRERMFLIGFAEARPLEVRPVGGSLRPTVRGALKELPTYGSRGNETYCVARITPARKPVLRRSPFAGMLFNGQGRPLNLDAPALTLPASMGGNRTPIIDQEELETGAACWVIDYHRHLWAGGEPATRIPDRLRRITVEEAAAIQTFPAGMEWCGRTSAKFRQIGNAVPPRLAFHVALAVRKALEHAGAGHHQQTNLDEEPSLVALTA